MIKKILNIGISDENEESLNRKIRLSNLIALFIIIVSASCMPLYIGFKLIFLVYTGCLIIFISLLCIYLQSLKKHFVSFCLLIFSTVLLLDIVSLNFGLVANMHFFLLCSCMTALILFEDNKLIRNCIIGFSISSFFAILLYFQNENSLPVLPDEISKGLRIYGYFNYFILFVFTIIFFASFVKQIAAFQKKLSLQNTVLEHKNSQITDSITYAKHIQEAILPPMASIKNYLKESFIFYKPKDIVAGDFYWMEAQKDGSVLFAAADSTGHGVPGAMVSVVCTNALNQAVKEFGLTEPGAILDKVRELVVDCFRKSETEVKDGMDISLCLINSDKRELKWAGANNPLWIIRSNTSEVSVIKPDKQSVGKTGDPKPFTTHTVQLNEGDCFYLFTDGYADQFGGGEAKKFMQKRMKELLVSICKKPMELQKKLIQDNLTTWMGNIEQVDDICFAGIKL